MNIASRIKESKRLQDERLKAEKIADAIRERDQEKRQENFDIFMKVLDEKGSDAALWCIGLLDPKYEVIQFLENQIQKIGME
jgi:hypothetical protein